MSRVPNVASVQIGHSLCCVYFCLRHVSRVPNVASVYIVQSVLCCAVFNFVFVMCLVCLMLPVSRLSILCVVLCLFLSSSCVSCA